MALVECNGCESKWGGASRCHCGGCHVTFTGLTSFEAHRRGGVCLEPSQVGLVEREGPYSMFGYPPPPDGVSDSSWWSRTEASASGVGVPID